MWFVFNVIKSFKYLINMNKRCFKASAIKLDNFWTESRMFYYSGFAGEIETQILTHVGII